MKNHRLNGELYSIKEYRLANSGIEYFYKDRQASIKAAASGDGNIRQRIDYTPFGEPLGTWSLSAGYLSKPYDFNTRLSNYGFRDYAPHTGCFTTVDPIRDGLNWYAYCNNDPVNYIDTDGLILHMLLGGALGTVVSVGVLAIADYFKGEMSSVADYVGAAVGGFASGSVMALGYNGYIAGAAGGLVGNFVKQLVENKGDVLKTDFVELAFAIGVGTATGVISNKAIPGITSGKGSMLSVANQIKTKLANGTIKKITAKTAAKIAIARTTDCSLVEGSIFGLAATKVIELIIDPVNNNTGKTKQQQSSADMKKGK